MAQFGIPSCRALSIPEAVRCGLTVCDGRRLAVSSQPGRIAPRRWPVLDFYSSPPLEPQSGGGRGIVPPQLSARRRSTRAHILIVNHIVRYEILPDRRATDPRIDGTVDDRRRSRGSLDQTFTCREHGRDHAVPRNSATEVAEWHAPVSGWDTSSCVPGQDTVPQRKVFL